MVSWCSDVAAQCPDLWPMEEALGGSADAHPARMARKETHG
jgi:hypothetical protein